MTIEEIDLPIAPGEHQAMEDALSSIAIKVCFSGKLSFRPTKTNTSGKMVYTIRITHPDAPDLLKEFLDELATNLNELKTTGQG